MTTRTVPQVVHRCHVYDKTVTAAPEATVTCTHGDTFARLRPATIARQEATQ